MTLDQISIKVIHQMDILYYVWLTLKFRDNINIQKDKRTNINETIDSGELKKIAGVIILPIFRNKPIFVSLIDNGLSYYKNK